MYITISSIRHILGRKHLDFCDPSTIFFIAFSYISSLTILPTLPQKEYKHHKCTNSWFKLVWFSLNLRKIITKNKTHVLRKSDHVLGQFSEYLCTRFLFRKGTVFWAFMHQISVRNIANFLGKWPYFTAVFYDHFLLRQT